MTQWLRYGSASTLELEISPDALVADCTPGRKNLVPDPVAAVSEALANPVGYPPLAQAVVPGDRVVIALDPHVPCWRQITAGVVQTLITANVNPSDIVVLTSDEHASDASWQADLPGGGADLGFVIHDPHDKAGLCYLAASKQAEPIYLNRHLCEADVIVPVNLLRARRALGYSGIHSGLFPTFSDEATRQRFRGLASARNTVRQKRQRSEAKEVDWLLGLQLAVQIVAGPGDSVLHVLAGMIRKVTRPARELVEAAWAHQVPRRAELVVAAIEGGSREQSWENFGRALYAASQVCAAEGTIVLCTDLQRAPGVALKQLTGYEQDARLRKRLQQVQSEDAVSAALLLEHRQRQHIYLLSGLDASTVESLGVAYITDAEEINHLSRHAESCILLADAQRASPRVG
ncbi:MAG: lactate racemase domain-containing protein [Pirellulaceae bacterium]